MASERSRRRSFVWPFILIGLGVILLLQNLGLIAEDFWEILVRFWPLILILVGLELIFHRGNPWLGTALVGVVLLLVIGAGIALSALGYFGPVRADDTAQSSERITQELGGYERTAVDLEFGAGDLVVGALPSDAANLMEGDFRSGSGRMVSRSFECGDQTCQLRLRSRSGKTWSFGRNVGAFWDVRFAPRAQLDMRIQTGASRLDLDLSELRLGGLRLDVGASNGTITLPRTMDRIAVVKAGAADLEIRVPLETAARIKTRSGLSSIDVDENRFVRDGDYYVSPNFSTATNRVELDLDVGVASIRIR